MSFKNVVQTYESGLTTLGMVVGGYLLLTASFLADVLR